MDLNEIYSSLVMEHSANSPHKKELENYTKKQHGHNPSCGDDITLFVKIENGTVTDAGFTGVGCAISQSSTSIMIETIKGKTVEEAKKLVDVFVRMIDRKPITDDEKKLLKNARAFENIKDMPARVKCALLAWKTFEKILDENKG